jgi:hypothetical protein
LHGKKRPVCRKNLTKMAQGVANFPNDFGKKGLISDMGGVGSGSWYRYGTKETVEGLKKLDVNRLHRQRLLNPGCRGSISWSKGENSLGSIGFEVKDRCLVLDYRYRRASEEWEEVRYPVQLTWTPCNYGGDRPWFVCSGVVNGYHCGRRVGKLYSRGKYFLCRHCHDLTYESRKDGQKYRALHKCQRIRQRLGGSANMTELFPPKPKGMHFDTYFRLWREHERAEQEYTRRMIVDLAKPDIQLSRIGRGR